MVEERYTFNNIIGSGGPEGGFFCLLFSVRFRECGPILSELLEILCVLTLKPKLKILFEPTRSFSNSLSMKQLPVATKCMLGSACSHKMFSLMKIWILQYDSLIRLNSHSQCWIPDLLWRICLCRFTSGWSWELILSFFFSFYSLDTIKNDSQAQKYDSGGRKTASTLNIAEL